MFTVSSLDVHFSCETLFCTVFLVLYYLCEFTFRIFTFKSARDTSNIFGDLARTEVK